jgi:hypothetical protein
MIVRILHDKQYQIPETFAKKLDSLDAELTRAMNENDRGLFDSKLAEIIDAIRNEGETLPPEKLLPSDVTVPAPGSSLDEVKELLAEDEPEQ